MAREYAQVWAASNAGDSTSVVLAYLRKQAHFELGDPDGINGSDVPDADAMESSLGIFEWSATPGVDVRDRDGWAQANPSLGHTGLNERALVAALAAPESKFRTENLCQWVDTMREGVFPPGVWEANQVDDSFRVSGSPVVAVDTRTGMRQSYAVVVAGMSDGFDLVDVARYELGMDAQWADDYIVSEVAGICSRLNVDRVVVDKFGENAHLIPKFEEVGLTVTRLDTADMRGGAVGFTDALINGRVKHKGQEPLSVAVLGAEKRSSGEGFLWSQARSSTDITPLRATTAAWWVYANGAQVSDPLDSMF
jgi:phage terminase large subunit-like protein